MTTRSVPQVVEAEQALLAKILLDPDSLHDISGEIRAEDFSQQRNQFIFSAIMEQSMANQPYDYASIGVHLSKHKLIGKAGGQEYLYNLVNNTVTATDAMYHCRVIKEKSILRSLIKKCECTINDCYESTDAFKTLNMAHREILSVDYTNEKSTPEHIHDILLAQTERHEAIYKNERSITGISSGFPMLDQMTGGFQNSDLTILAARPSMGKTAFALNLANNVSAHGIPVAVFEMEMSKGQLADRLMAICGNINLMCFRSGVFRDLEWAHIIETYEKVSSQPIWVDDTPSMSLMECMQKARKLKRYKEIQMLIIDYVQLMTYPGARRREEEIATISRNMKALAKELDIPIILLSQLNRELERRPEKRPQLSDLRESGSLEQDADMVMFLYRDEVYHENSSEPNVAEIIISKHRQGPTGTIKLNWNSRYNQFRNLEGRY